MQLVIVESPTKSRILQQFLGSKYKVLASYGHIRDLPKGELGVDTEHNFTPRYVIPTKSRKTLNLLKKEAEKAESIILAVDSDREGEAIAWHLTEALNLNGKKTYQRIVFHEITKPAIMEALKNPRKIDTNLANAQQARRILDRIVGYQLSPFLWKKIARGLSAGRVQSVAVRLVVEREKEIENFVGQEYWSISAILRKIMEKVQPQNPKNDSQNFEVLLIKKDGKAISKFGIKTKKETEEIVKNLEGAEYKVVNITKKEVKRNPLPPLITSTLQQEAWKKFHFPAKFTMRIAQQLYERGAITYHRTDSLNLSESALSEAKKFIEENYGKDYWAGFLRKYKAKGRVQEAHEAIRPTCPDQEPEKLKTKKKLDDNQLKLYDLIWRRFIASQMAQARFDATTIDVSANNYIFRAAGQVLKFEGFLKIYPIKFEETELPLLEKGQFLELIELIPSQHFTKPPSRYTEASLIKTLEENGVGRPSTYAPTLSTIQTRNYIQKDERKRLEPTEIGRIVNDLLVEHFPAIVDIKFTARLEEDLDKIAQNQKEWIALLKEFYEPFAKNLEQKYKEISKKEIAETATDKTCPKCGAPLIIKLGRFGKFYACSKFPECKHTAPLKKQGTGIKCPKCEEGEIVEKRTKKGRYFFGCNRFPKCDFALWDKPLPGPEAGTGQICPKCGALLVETKKGIRCSNKECDYYKK